MIKKLFCISALLLLLNHSTKAQEFYEFDAKTLQIGLIINVSASLYKGGEESLPFFGNVSAGGYLSYDINDWFKVSGDVRYQLGINPSIEGFLLAHSVTIPVVGLFKVGRGYIGAGLQQSIMFAHSSGLNGLNMNPLCAIIEFCYFTHWSSDGKWTVYSETGFHPTMRLGISLNKVGYAPDKGRYFFLEGVFKLNFNKDKRKKSGKRRRR
ncbi:MAG: hypothetical protein LBL74_00030 [Bacteroidales bacterium]|nr:hypothetical protein [Bacteroidales bacterium]